MERIRVLLVDEDLDWIEGLIYFLEKQPDIYIVGKTLSGWEVVQLAAQLDPNVVLMSILLSNHLESLKFTLEISRHGRAKVIMLMTSLEKDEIVVNAFKAGAVDYVVKTHLEEIPDVIRAAHQNRSPIRPCVAEKIRQELCRLSELERLYKRGTVYMIHRTYFPEMGLIWPIVLTTALFTFQQILNTNTVLQGIVISSGAVVISVIGSLLIEYTGSFLPALMSHLLFVIFYLGGSETNKATYST